MALCLLVGAQSIPFRRLEAALAEAGHVVLHAQGGRASLALLRSQSCSVIILAYLPAPAALDLCRQIRSSAAHAVVVALDADRDDHFGTAVLQAGADIYLPAQAGAGLVTAALEAALRRQEDSPATIDWPERVLINELDLDLARGVVRRQGRKIEVTPSEFRILRYLATNAGRVVSNQLLVQEALGYATNRKDASDVLKVHVHRLREKIEPDPGKPVYLVNVRGLGYMLERRRTAHPGLTVVSAES